MQSYSNRAKRGFTLVEILVVIGVIMLLSAIMFPVFGRVREAGRRTACASNMRQLGLAFSQYVQDAADRLPIAFDGPYGAQKTGGWTYYETFGGPGVKPKFDPTQGSLYTYVRAAGVYVCPSDTEGRTTQESYAANSCVFRKVASGPGECNTTDVTLPAGDCRVGKKLTSFRTPTEWMLLNEEARDSSDTTSSTDDGYLNLKYTGDPAAYQNTFSQRHFSGSVLTFLDGHSKWYSVGDITTNKFQIGGPSVTATLADGCPVGVQ